MFPCEGGGFCAHSRTADVPDPLCVLRALTAFLDRRDGTAAGCIVARGKVHTGLGHGEPALGVRQNGLDAALFVLLTGCARGQHCSQRADTGEPSAPRARGALPVRTPCCGSRVAAVLGRPGHVCTRIGVGGVAFSHLWAGWTFGSLTHAPFSHTPSRWHALYLSAVNRACGRVLR